MLSIGWPVWTSIQPELRFLPLLRAEGPLAVPAFLGIDSWQPSSTPPSWPLLVPLPPIAPGVSVAGILPPVDTAAAGLRAAVYAQEILQRYARWIRTPEGRDYLSWRSAQLQLPEENRQVGTWGSALGLNGYLRGNKPKHLWARWPAGQTWKFRCNVFVWDAAYAGGYAVPSFTHPDALAHRFLREEQGGEPPKERLHDYFQRVPDISQARAGDWLLLGKPTGSGRVRFGHVVLVTGPGGGGRLPVAQAGSNPMPEATALSFRDGALQSSRHRVFLLLRPTRLRPRDPVSGQPVKKPTL